MNECICCSDRLLKHISHQRMYWFCPSCRQEMPNITKVNQVNQAKIYSLKSLKRHSALLQKTG